MVNLDDIKYGNIVKSHLNKIKEDRAGLLKSALDLGIIEDILTNHKFPPNSSKETYDELIYLQNLTQNADDEDIKFCKLMDTNHYDFFVIVAKKLGIDVSKSDILQWVGDVDPITFYLKNKFNRPRPHQLANELKIPMYPIIVTDADSASYPSGHTMDFLIILYKFGKIKPELSKELASLYEKIKTVRELSGVHYPSDRRVSEILFKKLIKHKLVK